METCAGFFFWRITLDRQIVYPAAIPLETDLLNTNKAVQLALGQFAQDVLGTSTIFSGLACVPNSPAAMNVVVQPGAAYAQAALDSTAYSSLAADSFVTQKQGILKTSTTFNTPAPTTAGQSINYLISAAFVEGDTNLTVLPYYNAANPSQAYAGPNNTGASQATTRQCTIQLTLTAGTPATTGSQTTPATPNGQSALYVVTVAYGATTVIAGNIAKASGAPFLSASLLAQIQAIPTTGRLLNVQTFTASGTYTPTAGTTKVRITCVGGGASGGGAAVTTASQYAVGAGGGAGAYCVSITAVSNVSGSAITVGAGGASASSSGNSGGATSVGSFCSAAGGFGGSVGLAVSSPVVSAGGAGGLTVSGTYNYWGVGGSGSPGIAFGTGNYISGTGGACFLSAGAPANTTAGQGNTANGYGAGGAGASSSGGSAAQASGPGHAGIVIIEEFA
jgi:hypothetical protein